MSDRLDEIETKVKHNPEFTDEERKLLNEVIVLWRGIKSMGIVGKWLSAIATIAATLFLAITSIKG